MSFFNSNYLFFIIILYDGMYSYYIISCHCSTQQSMTFMYCVMSGIVMHVIYDFHGNIQCRVLAVQNAHYQTELLNM